MKDMEGADVCVDIHASNIFLWEIPQVRLSENTAQDLVPLARHLNMNLIWIYASATVLESTLAYSLNAAGTPTLVVEMGVGMRITRAYTQQLFHGILSLMSYMGIWKGSVSPTASPIISTDGHVSFINASSPGIFLPSADHASQVEAGQELGMIVDPLTGNIRERLTCPVSGLLFTLREYPVVSGGSLVARILGGSL